MKFAKSILLNVFFAVFCAPLFAQPGVAINNDNSNPDASSILDVKSTSQGMLVPRMLAADKLAIVAPATGLLIFQTDGTAGFYYYDGIVWVPIAGSSGVTLDGAYDFGGAGLGRIITADAGVMAVNGTDGFLNTGFLGSGLPIGEVNGIPEGAGVRMFFNPAKAAFRAGLVMGTQWDNVNVGFLSTAMGGQTTASGFYSTALGGNTTASAFSSTAMGQSTIASGSSSTAMGENTIASGNFSTAMGVTTTASGDYSTAMGMSTTAPSFGETTIGINSTAYAPLNAISFNAADRLFTIGNGADLVSRSDAMVVLKNGNTGIGTSTPSAKLDIAGTFKLADGTQAAGRVLTSDAAGLATWATAGTSSISLDGAYDFGGAGQGRSITADAGVVAINGTAGFLNTGTLGSGLAIGGVNGIPEGFGTRMFFNPAKAAFRAGFVNGTQWDNVNVGLSSTAMGYITTASGNFSTAMGVSTIASGPSSTAMGQYTIASGTQSTAMGGSTTASGNFSTAMGANTIASGTQSTAMGGSTIASGIFSTAMGAETTASGIFSTAMGYSTTASGSSSTAMGYSTTASGNYSTAMGSSTTAPSFGETTIGLHSTSYTPLGAIFFSAADRLFTIGNGADILNRSDAMVVLKNGNTGIGTSAPTAKLHVAGTFKLTDGSQAAGRVLTSDAAGLATWAAAGTSGVTLDGAYDFGGAGLGRIITADAGVVAINGTDGFLNTGTFGSGLAIGVVNGIPQGAGTRMFFNPAKAAFRAGKVNGTQWDNVNVGIYSTAMGSSTTASGINSTAMGDGTTSSGLISTAMGSSTTASGINSTAMGAGTTASGNYSTAMGYITTAAGDYSTAMGFQTRASGFYSTAMGGEYNCFRKLIYSNGGWYNFFWD